MNTAYLLWALRRTSYSLGFWGGCGLVLCVAAGMIMLTTVEVKQQIMQKQVAMSEARTAYFKPTDPALKEQIDESFALESFYKRFPVSSELTHSLSQLYSIANRHKIKLPQGDYKLRLNKNTEAALDEYELVLPLSGQYLHLRAFVDEALTVMPELALVQLEISRETVAQPTVNVNMVWVLYARRTL